MWVGRSSLAPRSSQIEGTLLQGAPASQLGNRWWVSSPVGDDRGVDDPSTPWRFEGTLVEHPTYGRGRLVAEPNSGWFQFVPVGSGPIVAIPAHRALSQVRVIAPDEMTDDELEDLDWVSARWSPLADVDPPSLTRWRA